jgi:hypothetical protein
VIICCRYHPVIKDVWNGEMTILVADVALGECKDLGYGSQSCPNDDFNAWCEEGANRAECGKCLPEEKRMTPKRPPLLQVTGLEFFVSMVRASLLRALTMQFAASQGPSGQKALRGPSQRIRGGKFESLRHHYLHRGRLEHASKEPG